MISDVSKREFKELCYKKNRIAQRANWMEKNSLFESAFDRWVFAAQGRQGGAGGAVYAKYILELNNGFTNVHHCIIIL